MEIESKIPAYDGKGLKQHWENEFVIDVTTKNGAVLISANTAGLISLAIQLLTLAQDSVPEGCHLHFDKYNSLGDYSNELLIEKI